jgi:hypothetical protein
MRPHPVPRPVRLLPALAATALLAVALSRVAAAPAPAPAAKPTGTIEARVILLGTPVAGVPIQVRNTGEPGLDVWMEDSTAVVDTTDAKGIARFAGLPAGRYHVLAHCGRLPGDRIAGSISTRAEVIPGQVAHSTLTLRPGGRIRGRVLEGDRPVSRATVETQTIDALPSNCPTLDTRNPGPDGRFEVGRVPINTFLWVKVYRPLGGGDVQLWKDFTLAAADTIEATWNFPALDSARLATVRLGVRIPGEGPADLGRIELSTIHPDGWRYFAGFDFTTEDSLHTLPSVPPGRYGLRATCRPGTKKWWNAQPESLVVEPGAKITRLLTGSFPR